MIGAIAGDVIGSVFEHYAIKSTQFELFSRYSRFTDDTVLTMAIANAIMRKIDYDPLLGRLVQNIPKPVTAPPFSGGFFLLI